MPSKHFIKIRQSLYVYESGQTKSNWTDWLRQKVDFAGFTVPDEAWNRTLPLCLSVCTLIHPVKKPIARRQRQGEWKLWIVNWGRVSRTEYTLLSVLFVLYSCILNIMKLNHLLSDIMLHLIIAVMHQSVLQILYLKKQFVGSLKQLNCIFSDPSNVRYGENLAALF